MEKYMNLLLKPFAPSLTKREMNEGVNGTPNELASSKKICLDFRSMLENQ
jgi:hypothetical protein